MPPTSIVLVDAGMAGAAVLRDLLAELHALAVRVAKHDGASPPRRLLVRSVTVNCAYVLLSEPAKRRK